MKLAHDADLGEWLAGITGEEGQLDWDAGNRAKNRKHDVEPSEVAGTKGGSMKKRSSKAVRKKAAKLDLQVEEFESRDLGGDIRAAGGLRAIRKTLPTSIVLEKDLVDKLREKGAKRGLGYQTMLKLIAREHVDEY